MSTDKNHHQTLFDCLKAIAITGIFFWHYYGMVYQSDFDISRQTLLFKDGFIVGICNIALGISGGMASLFIIASGFGLYLSYLKTPPAWPAFYRRRLMRLLPLYWAAVALIYFFVLKEDGTLKGLAYHVFLLQTFTSHEIEYGTLWFVGYIVQLYLMFPLLVRAFKRPALKWALVIGSFLITPAITLALDAMGIAHYGKIPTQYLPLFVAGMLMAEACLTQTALWRALMHPATSASGAVLLYVFIYANGSVTTLAPISMNIYYLLVFSALIQPSLLLMRLPYVSAAIGRIACASYVIMLAHMGLMIKMLEWLIAGKHIGGGMQGGVLEVIPGTLAIAAGPLLYAPCAALSHQVQRAYDRITA